MITAPFPPQQQPAPPDLSVVVVVGDRHDRTRRCLEHLVVQTAFDRLEIIVVDLATTPSGENRFVTHPQIIWLRGSPAASYGAAREDGSRRARAPLLAFIEDHCDPEPCWAEEILAAFDEPSTSIVNYAVKPSNEESWLARMFTMCEYGRWMVPAISGPVPISTCQNVAYRREALIPFWNTLGQWLDGEALLGRAIQRRGGTVWLAADATIAHESWARLSTGLRANRTMKRVFGAERARKGNFGWFAKIAWAAAMVMTPPLHLWRLGRSLVRRPKLWPLFWISLPLMVLVYGACAQAEAAGYLFGEGDGREQFRDLEISIERQA